MVHLFFPNSSKMPNYNFERRFFLFKDCFRQKEASGYVQLFARKGVIVE